MTDNLLRPKWGKWDILGPKIIAFVPDDRY